MKEKVLVAMSGGVDSAVAALLLIRYGYEVIGATISMHNYSNDSVCEAKEICDILKIEHIIVDATDRFNDIVLADFINEYLSGFTPNPCVLCNKELKWKAIIDTADRFGIDKIATGHYAKIKYYSDTDEYTIIKSQSAEKDQTYMLWRLPQEYLARTMFPLSDINSKQEVRNIAKKHNIPSFGKSDSQDICFLPDNNYHDFLRPFCEKANIKQGDIYLDGEKIGEHIGYPYYTIGQRRGLGISYKQPLYVKEIDANNNKIIVATADNLSAKGLIACKINLMKKKSFFDDKEIIAKIRYKDAGKPVFCDIKDDKLIIFFKEPRNSITPGQSVVLYYENELIGGGIIEANIN